MATLTPNYNLIKPGVNDPTDQDLWGGYLNEDMDIIDNTMKSISDSISSAVPVGVVVAFAGSVAPANFELCYGQALNRVTYADLFAALGTTYGSGDGSTTFNIPDMRGRAVAGKDNMGGVSADRLTGLTGGVDGDVLGGTGGSQTHTLTVPEIPPHRHDIHINPFTFGGGASARNGVEEGDVAPYIDTQETGGGGAHNNVQPTIILNYIIKAL